jgi:hypothetical protein
MHKKRMSCKKILNLFKKTTISHDYACIKLNICNVEFVLLPMNYLAPHVRLDMRYVLCLYASLDVIGVNSFLGCARPNQREASLGIVNQGEYWEFFYDQTTVRKRRSSSIQRTQSFEHKLQILEIGSGLKSQESSENRIPTGIQEFRYGSAKNTGILGVFYGGTSSGLK